MRNFFLTCGEGIVWFLAVVEIVIMILSLKKKKGMLSILSASVCVGLAVDALIQAIGVILGAGAFLQGISQIRYILHGILVPLLIPISFYAFGIQKKVPTMILWIVTGCIILMGIVMGFQIKTMPEEMAGVLRYANDKSLTPAFASTMELALSFGGVIPLILMGIANWIKNKSPFVFLAGLFMFAFSALGPATGNLDLNFLITMIGEAFMVLFFYFEILKKRA